MYILIKSFPSFCANNIEAIRILQLHEFLEGNFLHQTRHTLIHLPVHDILIGFTIVVHILNIKYLYMMDDLFGELLRPVQGALVVAEEVEFFLLGFYYLGFEGEDLLNDS